MQTTPDREYSGIDKLTPRDFSVADLGFMGINKQLLVNSKGIDKRDNTKGPTYIVGSKKAKNSTTM